jgi:protein-S-isoprenylcysteine O-methyltransferase Ste14
MGAGAAMSALDRRVPPPLLAILFAAAMWVAARLLPDLTVRFSGQALAAILALVAGVEAIAAAWAQFLQARTTVNPVHPERATSLMTGGVFGLTRNPMYLGLALALLGWMLWLGNGASALLLAGFVGYLTRFQIIPEERALRANFGEQFAAYARRVRRWI